MNIRDIEDNYPNYLDDALGYSFDAWDRVKAKDRAIHDEVLSAQLSEISSFSPTQLPSIALWALAKRQSESTSTLDAFEKTVCDLVTTEDPCLDRHGISTFAMRHMIRIEETDRAEGLLEKLEPLQSDKDLWIGLLSRTSNPDLSRGSLQAWVDKDSRPIEAILDIVETLIYFGDRDAARHWLDEASRRATTSNYTSTLVDIELLRTSLNEDPSIQHEG